MSLIRSTELQLMKALQRAGAAAGETADESAQSSSTPAEESADGGDASAGQGSDGSNTPAEEGADGGDASAEESADGGEASAEKPLFRRTWFIIMVSVFGFVLLVLGGLTALTWRINRQDRMRRLSEDAREEALLFQPLNDPNIPQSDEGPDNFMEGPRQSG